MPGKPLRLPGHASAEQQLAAIAALRKQGSEDGKKVAKITAAAKAQKADSRAEAHKRQWLTERDILKRERRGAQLKLDEAIDQLMSVACADKSPGSDGSPPLSLLVRTMVMERAAAAGECTELCDATLIPILGLKAKVGAHAGRKSRKEEEVEIQQALEQCKRSVAEELADLDRVMAKLTEDLVHVHANAMRVDCSGAASDDGTAMTWTTAAAASLSLEDIEAGVEAQFAVIAAACPHCPPDATGLFRSAIEDALTAAGTALITASSAGSTLSPPQLPQPQQDRIVALAKEYDPSRNTAMRGRTKEELYDRIRFEFPSISAADARWHVSSLLAQRQEKHRLQSLLRDLKANVEALFAQLRQVAEAEEALWHVEELRLQALAAEDAEREAKRREIESMRAAKKEQEALRLEAQMAEEAKIKALQAAKQRRLDEEYRERLQRLTEFQEAKAALEEAQLAIEAEERAEREREREAQAQHNAERVAARRQQYEAKMDTLRLNALMLEEEKTAREEALEAFYAQAERAIGVERDPERVLKPTVASQQEDSYVPVNQQARTKQTGFSDDKIVNDPRVKIHNALVSAGLQHTSYGRSMLRQGLHQSAATAQNATSAANPLRSNYN